MNEAEGRPVCSLEFKELLDAFWDGDIKRCAADLGLTAHNIRVTYKNREFSLSKRDRLMGAALRCGRIVPEWRLNVEPKK